MDKQKSKKEYERYILEWFLNGTNWDYQEITPYEAPDFIVRVNDRKIGIELTQFFYDESKQGSPQRELESRRSRFLHNVSEKYYQDHSDPLLVEVIFHQEPDQVKVTTKNFEDEFLRFLVDHLPSVENKQQRFELERDNRLILVIFIRKLPNEEPYEHYNRWRIPGNSIGWLKQFCKDKLQRKIADKAQGLPQYPDFLDETALLLYADGTKSSGMIDLPPAVDFYHNGYDSVYLCKRPDIRITSKYSKRPCTC